MTNNHKQQTPNSDDKIQEAIGYWARLKSMPPTVSVAQIERRKRRRALERTGVAVVVMMVAVTSLWSIARLDRSNLPAQVAHQEPLAPDSTLPATGTDKSTDEQWDILLAQIAAEQEKTQQHIANLEQAQFENRINRSIAIADQAWQWTAEQNTSF